MKSKLLFCLALLLSAPLHGKSVDLSAHFDSESYWSSHAIYLARITDIKIPSTGNTHYVTSFHPIKTISGAIDATNRSVSSNPGQIMDFTGPTGEQPLEFPLGAFIGDEMLVSEDTRYHQVTIVRVLQFPDDQSLLVVLERIAGLRKDPTLAALLASATSEFDLESEYCLNRLLTLPDTTISSSDLKKLQFIADDGERPPALRIAAEEAELKFSATPAPDRCDAEYNWLHQVIQAACQNTNVSDDLKGCLDSMRPLVYRLLEFEAKRKETADFILRLVADQKVPAGLRDAACSALSGWDQQVFNFQNPDEQFGRMFDTYLGLLRDKNPDLRILGVSMLFDRTLDIMTMQSPPDHTREYSQRAIQALRKAMDNESDSRVMLFFSSRMEILKDKQSHLQSWKNQMNELEMNSAGTNGRQ